MMHPHQSSGQQTQCRQLLCNAIWRHKICLEAAYALRHALQILLHHQCMSFTMRGHRRTRHEAAVSGQVCEQTLLSRFRASTCWQRLVSARCTALVSVPCIFANSVCSLSTWARQSRISVIPFGAKNAVTETKQWLANPTNRQDQSIRDYTPLQSILGFCHIHLHHSCQLLGLIASPSQRQN